MAPAPTVRWSVGMVLIPASLFRAHETRALLARTSAQGAQVCCRVGDRDHGVRPGILFTIERCGLGDVEPAGRGILRLVEPEANVKRVSWRERSRRIEAKD